MIEVEDRVKKTYIINNIALVMMKRPINKTLVSFLEIQDKKVGVTHQLVLIKQKRKRRKEGAKVSKAKVT